MNRRLASFLALALLLLCLAAPALAQGENLLLNGGFEDGLDEEGYIGHWSFDAWEGGTEATVYRLETDPQRGEVLCIDSKQDNDARLEQTIQVSGNSLYKISGYLKAEGFDPEKTGANLSVKDCFAVSADYADTDGEWVYVEFYGRTAWFQGSITICARAGFYGETNQGVAWFDDLSVEKVDALPEGAQAQSLKKVAAAVEEDEGGKANWAPAFIFLCAAFAAVAAYGMSRSKDLSQRRRIPVRPLLWGGLALALLLRLYLSVTVSGYEVDMNCFAGWAFSMASEGPAGIYEAVFCDYPPGYLYVLWLIGGLGNLFQLPYNSELFQLLLKLPASLADLATAYLIYRMAKEWTDEGLALVAALVYAFAPTVWLDSAMWGQMDSILVLLVLLCIRYMLKKQMLKSSLLFTLAVLVKPQALMFGTVLLCGFASDVLENPKKGLQSLGISLVSALALVLLVAAPFSIGKGYGWLVEKYLQVLGSYPYATVNAMNLFGVLGGNWVDQGERLLGLSYASWGSIGMVLSVGYGLYLYFAAKDRRAVLPMAAMVLLGVFVLGVRMHERYLFPSLALVLLCALCYQDRRLLWVFAGLVVTNGANIFTVLQNEHILADNRTMQILVGCLNLLLMLEFGGVCFQLCVRHRSCPLVSELKPLGPQVLGPALPTADRSGERPRFTRWDLLLLSALTLVYGVTAFYRLGNTYAPATLCQLDQGQSVVLDLGQERAVGRFYYYGEINYATLSVSFSKDGQSYSEEHVLEMGVHDMFKWHVITLAEEARYVRLEVSEGDMKIFEVAVTDGEGKTYEITAPQEAAALVDEQWMVPERPGYMDSMYFDEVYHGRTAYEQIHNMTWYENTHPPLGKVFISWSILLFGMTPFGWRFAGTLAGVLMVPAIYYLAKLLFKKTGFAFAAAFLFAFDFMHLAQTRLGTIDSYPVLFIIMGFACMLHYAHMSFYHEKLGRTLVPLFFSGLFMGLGIASKWIGIYAGAGLAVFFFAILYSRFAQYRQAKRLLRQEGRSEQAVRAARNIVERFPKCALVTLLCCVLFFVVIPVGIYIGSYYQFLRIEGNGLEEVWNYQLHMFNYHKAVFDSHPYESPWYQWPLMLRPIWYFLGEFEPEGSISSIASFGNPAVWWPGLAAILWLIVRAAKGYGRQDKRIYIVLLGYFANFLPWVLVPRTTFIYHYFASVPFLTMAIGLFLEDFYARAKRGKLWIGIYLGAVLALYCLFYPVLTGISMPDVQGLLLEWLPSWTLF